MTRAFAIASLLLLVGCGKEDKRFRVSSQIVRTEDGKDIKHYVEDNRRNNAGADSSLVPDEHKKVHIRTKKNYGGLDD